MKFVKPTYYIFILFMMHSMCAQEWSSRIALVEEHLAEPYMSEEASFSIKEEYRMEFLQAEGALLAIHSENGLSAGINTMFEEVLESGFLVKDMMVYSLSVNYDIGRFNMSLMFENFLNVNQQEFEIQPILESRFGVVEVLNFSQESPFLAVLAISFRF